MNNKNPFKNKHVIVLCCHDGPELRYDWHRILNSTEEAGAFKEGMEAAWDWSVGPTYQNGAAIYNLDVQLDWEEWHDEYGAPGREEILKELEKK